MSWRSLYISRKAHLHIHQKQLVIEQDEAYPVPLEDIGAIIIDHYQVSITSCALAEIARHGIALFASDEKHMPIGLYLPFHKHSRQAKVMRMQMEITRPFQKRCWQQIVRRKLLNQAKCLQLRSKKECARKLKLLSKEVASGDSTNREGYGAQLYFRALFGPTFAREQDHGINAALNYGYAILRSSIARNLVGYGFIPSLGLFHRSELNSFNLADDFIEPLRPLVDLWTAKNMKPEKKLSKQNRVDLVNLLNHQIQMKGQSHQVSHGIEMMISSFSSACSCKKVDALELPVLNKLKLHPIE